MVSDRLLLSVFRNMCKIHHVLNTPYCPISHPSFCTMLGNLSQHSSCFRSWCSTFFYNMYTHYITHHVSFQQIISVNSSLYKQIPQSPLKRKKPELRQGFAAILAFCIHGQCRNSVYSNGVLFKGNQSSASQRILWSRRAPWAVMRRADRVSADSSRLGSSRPSPSASQVNRAGRSVQPT